MPTTSSCLICGGRDDLMEICVDETTEHLCAEHRAALGADGRRVFTERNALLSHPALDRRGGADRRTQERRMFPRPEGRRLGLGRRATDPIV